MTLIGVKSKYGSCSGNCTGLINIKNTQKKRKVPFVGMTGWTVNSIAKAVKGSSPFLPKKKIIPALPAKQGRQENFIECPYFL